MFSRAYWMAVDLVNILTAPLLAAYAPEVFGCGAIPAPDEMLMIEPPVAFIKGIACLVPVSYTHLRAHET